MSRNVPPADEPIRRYGAVGVVVRADRFLVIRRSAQVAAPGTFCFPGGGIEAGESEEQALVREIHEELGVPIRPVKRVWRHVTRWRVDLAWWLGEIDADALLVPNPDEVAAVHWMTPEEMLRHPKMLDSNREFLRSLADGRIML